MQVRVVDSKRRISLTRLEPVRSTRRMSFDECRAAIEAAPLRPALSWDELREATREP